MTTYGRTVTVFGGLAFLAAASFGICASANFRFGARRGIRIKDTGCLALVIRNFNSSKLIFKTNSQSWPHLPALTAL